MINMLLVDDESEVLELFKEACVEETEISLSTTNSALRAIEELSINRYDVVLTDLNMPTVNGKQLIAYIDSNIRNRNTVVYIHSGASDIEKFANYSPTVRSLFRKPMEASEIIEKIKSDYKRFARKSYTEELTQILSKVSTDTIGSIFECTPKADQPFNKKAAVTFGELSAMIPIFGVDIYGSVGVSMEKTNIEHAISKFSNEDSPVIRESMMLDYIIDIANSMAGNIKAELGRRSIEVHIGIPFGKRGLRSDFSHLVSGPVLCIPVNFDGDICFTEFCFGGLSSSRNRRIEVFKE